MKKLTSIIIVFIISCFCVSCAFSSDNNELFNSASTTAVKSCVKIIAENRKDNIFTSELKHVNIGSGVIFTSTTGVYYVITNNHVVEPVENNYRVLYKIYDCYGNEYSATLLTTSSEDDLALLSFSVGIGISLEVMSFADNMCKVGDTVVSIGSPNGIFNTVTVGKVTNLKEITMTDGTTSIEYPVICHTAVIDNGSSGGMLINDKLEIVGINFAGGVDENDNFVEGYAIPLDKVKNFISLYFG